MRRIKLVVAYDGTRYHGWQRQENAVTVQQVLEEALEKLTGEAITLTGAGRTDTGVHAWGQVCSFETDCHIPIEKFALASNTCLPDDIRIREAELVESSFHPRFDARAKWYRYRIYHHRIANPLTRAYQWFVPTPLDVESMQQAIGQIVGEHDFRAFAASGSEAKTTVREILSAQLTQQNAYLTLDIVGTAFLYNMVRIIAGTLVDIGRGHQPPDTFLNMLQSGDRLAGGMTAPAHGLTLMQVFYTRPTSAQIQETLIAPEIRFF